MRSASEDTTSYPAPRRDHTPARQSSSTAGAVVDRSRPGSGRTRSRLGRPRSWTAALRVQSQRGHRDGAIPGRQRGALLCNQAGSRSALAMEVIIARSGRFRAVKPARSARWVRCRSPTSRNQLISSWSSTLPASNAPAGALPCSIRFTGTSSFLPVRVCGMPGAANTSSGTCRGEACSRIAVRIRARRSSSSSAPGAQRHEQRHPVAAVGLVDADDQRLGDLGDLLDGRVDVGAAHPDAVAVQRGVRAAVHDHGAARR